eukprot:5276423-Pleurochrysis_carterae.AAC.1
MYHPIQKLVACKESTFKVRERPVSQSTLRVREKYVSPYAKRVTKRGQGPRQNHKDNHREEKPEVKKAKKLRGGVNLKVVKWGWRKKRENRRARRRGRRVRERSCGDVECASCWQTS